MAGDDENMDKTCAWLQTLIGWVDRQATSPIHYAGPGRTFGNRPATFMELVYLFDGEIPRLVMGPLTTRMKRGQFGLFNVHFGNVAPPESVFEGLCVFLDVSGQRSFDVLRKAPLALVSEVRDETRVKQAFTRVMERCAATAWTPRQYRPTSHVRTGAVSVAGQALLKAALLELLATLLEETAAGTDSGPSAGLPAGIAEAVAMMHRQYHQPTLGRDDLARAASMHPDHFTRAFRRRLGVSPMQYLAQVRAGQAGFLLTHTDQRVADIAEQVGYLDPFHFSRAFRQHQKQSPRAYRERTRQSSR